MTRRYPAYKDSGVEWLGEVPEGWHVVPVSKIAKIVNGYPFDSKLFNSESGTPLVRIRDLNAVNAETRYLGEVVQAVIVTKDDVLIGMDGDFNVGRWLSDEPALLNQRMCCVRGSSAAVTNYLEYALPVPLKLINDVTYSTTVKHLASHQVEKTRVCLPTDESELLSILSFLDRETAKIDALVAEQRRLIDLLREKRQAVISHAVTKGLNPNAALKPSGIDWLGDVPEGWEVRSLGSCSTVVRGASPRPAGDPRFFADDGVPWVTVAEITKDDQMLLTETASFLTVEGALNSRQFEPGTLLYSNSGATLGVPKILNVRACANDGVVGFLNLSTSVEIEFLYFFLSATTDDIREKVRQGSGQPNLNTDIVKNLKFALPPSLETQRQIVSFVKKKLADFASLTSTAETAITLLQERRAALISAAVTGKIDVRHLGATKDEAA